MTTPEPVVRPFAAFLTDTNRGKTHTELSDRLHHLIGEVKRLGKKGSLTLTVTLTPDGDMVTVTEQIAVKAPVPDPRKSMFFVTPDGNLTRSDPNQLSFDDVPVRAVPNTDKAAQ